MKDQKCSKTRGSGIGNFGNNVEGVEVFANTGIGNWKFLDEAP